MTASPINPIMRTFSCRLEGRLCFSGEEQFREEPFAHVAAISRNTCYLLSGRGELRVLRINNGAVKQIRGRAIAGREFQQLPRDALVQFEEVHGAR